MRTVLASTVSEWMYRGTEYTSRWQVLDEEGDPLVLDGSEELKMLLARTYTGPTLVEINGIIVIAGEGKIAFTLQPSDTEDLLAIAYDRTVLVNGNVATMDRFGIRAQVQEVAE